jgi:hypothetical protein
MRIPSSAAIFDDTAALHYAEIRADLERRGALIGANDLFIAAHGSRARADARDQQHGRVRASVVLGYPGLGATDAGIAA